MPDHSIVAINDANHRWQLGDPAAWVHHSQSGAHKAEFGSILGLRTGRVCGYNVAKKLTRRCNAVKGKEKQAPASPGRMHSILLRLHAGRHIVLAWIV